MNNYDLFIAAPRLSTVNQQVHGEHAGHKTNVGLDSLHISKPASMSSFLIILITLYYWCICNLYGLILIIVNLIIIIAAPKLDTVNQQVRGEAAGKQTGVGIDSIHLSKPLGMLLHFNFPLLLNDIIIIVFFLVLMSL